jgi:hypothetical protein
MTIYAKQFYYEWGDIALFAITIAMMLGGSASSTAGGFKGMRTGILFTALKGEVRRMVLPETRVKEQKYHHIRDIVLTDSVVKSAALIVILYVATFTVGTLAGLLAGFPLSMAAFESASAPATSASPSGSPRRDARVPQGGLHRDYVARTAGVFVGCLPWFPMSFERRRRYAPKNHIPYNRIARSPRPAWRWRRVQPLAATI